MGTLSLVTAGMGMWGWGAWVEQEWKNGDTEPGRTGPVLGYFCSTREGICRWPEGSLTLA